MNLAALSVSVFAAIAVGVFFAIGDGAPKKLSECAQMLREDSQKLADWNKREQHRIQENELLSSEFRILLKHISDMTDDRFAQILVRQRDIAAEAATDPAPPIAACSLAAKF